MEKIAIDCRLLNFAQTTGISRYTLFLIEYYSSRYSSRQISLITNDPTFKYGDCTIIYTKFRPYNILHFLFFSSIIKNEKIRYIHFPFYASFFLKPKDVTVVITVHDIMYKIVADFFGGSAVMSTLKRAYYNFIVTRSLFVADLIVTISKTTQDDLMKYFNKQSHHIPERSEIAASNNRDIVIERNLQEKGFFFYCGNARPHKNLQMVIDVFNQANIPPLVLAGKAHNASSNVKALGVVTDQELAALYQSAIAFIFPSKYEGFGLPILEALRLNTKVIASKIPAFTEFKSKNITYFDDKESLLSAIKIAMEKDFIPEPDFFDSYSESHIYELTDQIIMPELTKLR